MTKSNSQNDFICNKANTSCAKMCPHAQAHNRMHNPYNSSSMSACTEWGECHFAPEEGIVIKVRCVRCKGETDAGN